jgi:hypothetical protein
VAQPLRVSAAFENCEDFRYRHESYRLQVPDRKFYAVTDARRWNNLELLKVESGSAENRVFPCYLCAVLKAGHGPEPGKLPGVSRLVFLCAGMCSPTNSGPNIGRVLLGLGKCCFRDLAREFLSIELKSATAARAKRRSENPQRELQLIQMKEATE